MFKYLSDYIYSPPEPPAEPTPAFVEHEEEDMVIFEACSRNHLEEGHQTLASIRERLTSMIDKGETLAFVSGTDGQVRQVTTAIAYHKGQTYLVEVDCGYKHKGISVLPASNSILQTHPPRHAAKDARFIQKRILSGTARDIYGTPTTPRGGCCKHHLAHCWCLIFENTPCKQTKNHVPIHAFMGHQKSQRAANRLRQSGVHRVATPKD